MLVVSQSGNQFLKTSGLYIKKVVKEVVGLQNDKVIINPIPKYIHLEQHFKGEELGHVIATSEDIPVAKFITLGAAKVALREAIEMANNEETVRLDLINSDYEKVNDSDLWHID